MPTSILISIKPQWCELIASGEKTLEIRKTKPKQLTPPFKCYIYESRVRKKVIGEFVCDSICEYEAEFHNGFALYHEEIIKVLKDEDGCEYKILETANDNPAPDDCELLKDAAMTFQQVKDYVDWDGSGKLYGWHISELVIYDVPKDLSEFGVTKVSQSWCYVYDK